MSAVLSDVKATSRIILSTTKRIQGSQAKVEPLLIANDSPYMVLYLDLHSSCCFFDPSSAFREATDPFQNPPSQDYLDLPHWTLIELEGTSILNRI